MKKAKMGYAAAAAFFLAGCEEPQQAIDFSKQTILAGRIQLAGLDLGRVAIVALDSDDDPDSGIVAERAYADGRLVHWQRSGGNGYIWQEPEMPTVHLWTRWVDKPNAVTVQVPPKREINLVFEVKELRLVGKMPWRGKDAAFHIFTRDGEEHFVAGRPVAGICHLRLSGGRVKGIVGHHTMDLWLGTRAHSFEDMEVLAALAIVLANNN